MKKRLFALLLLVTFLVPSSPVVVFAQNEDAPTTGGACDATEQEQRAYIDAGAVYFDCEEPPEPSGGSGGESSGPLVGCDNAEKVWNFLIGKGMTDIQAAGSMGNLQHEGGFNPRIVEGGVWGGQDWPAEMDTIPPPVGPQGQPGYGIVQWTSPGRKEALQRFSDQQKQNNTPNSEVYELELQLAFMWSELSGPYRSAALDPLMQATTIEDAVRIWQDHYEVGSNFQPRLDAARDWLNRASTGNWCG